MIKAIVTDIEGTTSSLSFVHEVLFPYARQRMAQFVAQHADDPAVREQLSEVSQQVGKKLSDEQAVEQLIEWIDQDKKITPLKALQGMIWQLGYDNGDYQGHVYEDAFHNIKAWSESGISLYVYSSGSVKAQKLLFSHTLYGDMTGLFAGYFDTRIGGKREAGSYLRIAEELKLPAEQVLFLSDIVEELDAAKLAGMQTAMLNRSDQTISTKNHDVFRGFSEIIVR